MDWHWPPPHARISNSRRSTWCLCSKACKKGWWSLGTGGTGQDLWKGKLLETSLKMHSWEETLHAGRDIALRDCSRGWPMLGQGHLQGTAATYDLCQGRDSPEGLQLRVTYTRVGTPARDCGPWKNPCRSRGNKKQGEVEEVTQKQGVAKRNHYALTQISCTAHCRQGDWV